MDTQKPGPKRFGFFCALTAYALTAPDKDALLASLLEQVEALAGRVGALEAENKALRRENEALRAQHHEILWWFWYLCWVGPNHALFCQRAPTTMKGPQ